MVKSKQKNIKKLIIVVIIAALALFVVIRCVSFIFSAFGSVSKEQAEEFIEKLGWEIQKGSVVSEEITLPEKFDEVYERYNAIQLKQGYDLTKYKGAKAVKYTFKITNYKDYKNVEAHLLTWGGRIIGGDLCSTELNGFMTGLDGK